ncbi:MAG: OmpA family protein [Bdellovibrionota bacterium]
MNVFSLKYMNKLLVLLLCSLISIQTFATEDDWRLGLGIGPNFGLDFVDDELESDIGFSIWGDYYFRKQWFAHIAYDYFQFEDDPLMYSLLGGIGYELEPWAKRWFPYIVVGAGLSETQDFPLGIEDQTALTFNLRPGIEYAVSDQWWLGFAYEYVHVLADGSDNGADIALPFFSVTYRPNRLGERKREPEPEPPRQARVVEKDSDRDGVKDAIDACPNTPRGMQVDEIGCEPEEEEDVNADDDQDGVANAYDQCANTPRGKKVNGFGCQVQEKIQMRLTINFDLDSDVIKPQYYRQLNKVATLMKRNPKAKLLIEGHTDSTGTLKYNMNLSRRRSESIRTFLVGGGLVEGSRVSAKGFGPTKPVATNKTEEGRAKNRRILATFFY